MVCWVPIALQVCLLLEQTSVEGLLTLLSLCMNHCTHHGSAGEKTPTGPISLCKVSSHIFILNSSQVLQGEERKQTLGVFPKPD